MFYVKLKILNPGRASRCFYTLHHPRIEEHGEVGRNEEEEFRRSMYCVKDEIQLIMPGLTPVLLAAKPDCVRHRGDVVEVYEFSLRQGSEVSYFKLIQKGVQAALYALAFEEWCKRTGRCRQVKAYVVFQVEGKRYTIELPKDAAARARKWLGEAMAGNLPHKIYRCSKCPFRKVCRYHGPDVIRYDLEYAAELVSRALDVGLPIRPPNFVKARLKV